MKWHIGCSGFHYKEWKGVFYPQGLPQRKWFEYYSSVFDTLELNVTFYRFPQVAYLENWYTLSPAHFRFSMKAPRLITHYKQFKDCERLLDDFYNTATKGLREKVANILFQFPPAYDYRPERLELIAQSLRPSFRNVLEFRHASWWNEAVYDFLKKHKIIFCGSSYPGLPQQAVINNRVVYYRFHGIPKLFHSSYRKDTLRSVADQLSSNGRVKEAFIYFNNTASMAAIRNALWVKEYTTQLIEAT